MPDDDILTEQQVQAFARMDGDRGRLAQDWLRLRERLAETERAADWYIRCLEDIQDGRVVRGLDEAKSGWEAVHHA